MKEAGANSNSHEFGGIKNTGANEMTDTQKIRRIHGSSHRTVRNKWLRSEHERKAIWLSLIDDGAITDAELLRLYKQAVKLEKGK